VMGLGQKLLTQVELGQFFEGRFGSGWVSHPWFGFGLGKFTLTTLNFSIFYLRVKKYLFGSGQKVPGSKAGRLLIYFGSKVSSGRAHL